MAPSTSTLRSAFSAPSLLPAFLLAVLLTAGAAAAQDPASGTPVPPVRSSVPVGITATPAAPVSGARRSSRRAARDAARSGTAAQTAPTQPQKATEDAPLLPIPTLSNSLGVPSGTAIKVQLEQDISSADVHNGDTVKGTLAEPLKSLPAGTPVTLTVVSSAPAGTMQSAGVLSLQVIAVGDHPMLSETMSTQGKEGHKDVPDAAPTKGTEASFHKGDVITVPAA